MTTIFSVLDTATPIAKRDEAHATAPAQDFAHELARQEAPANPLAQGRAMPQNRFDARQDFQMLEPDARVAVDEAVPQAFQQLPVPQWLDEAQPVIAAPAGVTEALLEARVYGWHAMAQSYLSELIAADGVGKTPPVSQAVALAPGAVTAGSNEQQLANATMLAELVVQASAVAPVGAEPMQSSLAQDGAVPVTTATATPSECSAPTLWPERSLRFTRQRDGSGVAWIRDFRLGDAEATQLVRWVLNEARVKGLVLGKIMLNGREAWTSPQPLRSTS